MWPAGLSVSGQPPVWLAAGFGSGILLLGPIGPLNGAATGAIVGFILGASLASPAQASACEAAVSAGALVLIVQTHHGDAARIRGLLGSILLPRNTFSERAVG